MLVLGGPSPSSSSSTTAKNEGCAYGGRMESGGSFEQKRHVEQRRTTQALNFGGVQTLAPHPATVLRFRRGLYSDPPIEQ